MPLSNAGTDPLNPLAQDPTAQRADASAAHSTGLFLPSTPGGAPIRLRPQDEAFRSHMAKIAAQSIADKQEPQGEDSGMGPLEYQAAYDSLGEVSDTLRHYAEVHSTALTGGVLGRETAINLATGPLNDWSRDFLDSKRELLARVPDKLWKELEESRKDSGGLWLVQKGYNEDFLKPMADVQAQRDIEDISRQWADPSVKALFQKVGENNGIPIYRIPQEVFPNPRKAEYYDRDTKQVVGKRDSQGRQIYWYGERTLPDMDGTESRVPYGELVMDEYGWLPARYADAKQRNNMERRADLMWSGVSLEGAIRREGGQKARLGFSAWLGTLSFGTLTDPMDDRLARQASSLGTSGEHHAVTTGELLGFVTPMGAPGLAFRGGRAVATAAARAVRGKALTEVGKAAATEVAKKGFISRLGAELASNIPGATGAVAGGLVWEAMRPESGSEQAMVDSMAAELSSRNPSLSPEAAIALATSQAAHERFTGALAMFSALEYGISPFSRVLGASVGGAVGKRVGKSATSAAKTGGKSEAVAKAYGSLRADKAEKLWGGLTSGLTSGAALGGISPEVRGALWRYMKEPNDEDWNIIVGGLLIGMGVFGAHGAIEGLYHAQATALNRLATTKEVAREATKGGIAAEGERTKAEQSRDEASTAEAATYEEGKPDAPTEKAGPGEDAQTASDNVEKQANKGDTWWNRWSTARIAEKLGLFEETIVRRTTQLADSSLDARRIEAEVLAIRARTASRVALAMDPRFKEDLQEEVAALGRIKEKNKPKPKTEEKKEGELPEIETAPSEEEQVAWLNGNEEEARNFNRAVDDFVAEAGIQRQLDAILGITPIPRDVETDAAQHRDESVWQEIQRVSEEAQKDIVAAARGQKREAAAKQPHTDKPEAPGRSEEAAALSEEYTNELMGLLPPGASRERAAEIDQILESVAKKHGIDKESLWRRVSRGWGLDSLDEREGRILVEVATRYGVDPNHILDYLTAPEGKQPLGARLGIRKQVPIGLLPGKIERAIELPEAMPRGEPPVPKGVKAKQALLEKSGETPGTEAKLEPHPDKVKAAEEKPAPKGKAAESAPKDEKPAAKVRPTPLEVTGEAPKGTSAEQDVDALYRSVPARLAEAYAELPEAHSKAVNEFMAWADKSSKHREHGELAALRAIDEAKERGPYENTTPASIAKRARIVASWLRRAQEIGGREAVAAHVKGKVPVEPPSKEMTAEERAERLKYQASEAAKAREVAEKAKAAEAKPAEAKPAVEEAKPAVEEPKPAVEEPKPVSEEPKPAAEAESVAQEAKKTTTQRKRAASAVASETINTDKYTLSTELVLPEELKVDRSGTFQAERADIDDKVNMVSTNRPDLYGVPWDESAYATNPIIALETPEADKVVVAGQHRRARALGLHGSVDRPKGAIPVRVLRFKDGVPVEERIRIAKEISLKTNTAGKQLTNLELIPRVREEVNKGKKDKEIAQALGITPGRVVAIKNLSELPEAIIDLVRSGQLTDANKLGWLGKSLREHPGLWTQASATNFVLRLGKSLEDMSVTTFVETLGKMEERYEQKRSDRMNVSLPGMEKTPAEIAQEVIEYGASRSEEALLLESQTKTLETLQRSLKRAGEVLTDPGALDALRRTAEAAEKGIADRRERIDRLDRGLEVGPQEAANNARVEQPPTLFEEQKAAERSRKTVNRKDAENAIAAEAQKTSGDHFGILGFDSSGKLVAKAIPHADSLAEYTKTENSLLEEARRRGISEFSSVYRVGEAGGPDFGSHAARASATTVEVTRDQLAAAQARSQSATSLFDAPAEPSPEAEQESITFRGEKLNEHERSEFGKAIAETFDLNNEKAGLLGVKDDGSLTAVTLWSGTADQVAVDIGKVEELAKAHGLTAVLGVFHTHPGGDLPSSADHMAAATISERMPGLPLYVHNGEGLHEVVPASKDYLGKFDTVVKRAEDSLNYALEAYNEARTRLEAAKGNPLLEKQASRDTKETYLLAQKAEMEYYAALDELGMGNEANPITRIRRAAQDITLDNYRKIMADAEPGSLRLGAPSTSATGGAPKGRSFFRWLFIENGLLNPRAADMRAAYEARKLGTNTAVLGRLKIPRNLLPPDLYDLILRQDHQLMRALNRIQRIMYGRTIDERIKFGGTGASTAPLSRIERQSASSARISAALDGWKVGEWNSHDIAKEHGSFQAKVTDIVLDHLTTTEREVYDAVKPVLDRMRRRLFEHIQRHNRVAIGKQLRDAQATLKHHQQSLRNWQANTTVPKALRDSHIARAEKRIIAARQEVTHHENRLKNIADLRDPDTGKRWGFENYFHHIFEKDGEGPLDNGYNMLSPLSRRTIAKEKWAASLAKRTGREGFLLDLHRMFDVYIPDALGKMNLDIILEKGNEYLYGARAQAWGVRDIARDWHADRGSMRMDMALIYKPPTHGPSTASYRMTAIPGTAVVDANGRMTEVTVKDISTQARVRVFNTRADATAAGLPDAPLARHFIVRKGGLAEVLADPDKAAANMTYIENMLNRMSGRRESVDVWDKRVRGMTRTLANIEYHNFIGLLSTKAAVTNTIFGTTSLFSEIGVVYASKGLMAVGKIAQSAATGSTPESRRLFKILHESGARLESFVGWDEHGRRGLSNKPATGAERAAVAVKRASFALFTNTEKFVRSASYLGGYLKAEAAGWTPAECHRFAREVVSNTQFDMAAWAAPSLAQHPYGYLLLTLRRYAHNFTSKWYRNFSGVGALARSNITRVLGATPSDIMAKAMAQARGHEVDPEIIKRYEKAAADKNSALHIVNAGNAIRGILLFSIACAIYKELTGRDVQNQWASTLHDIPGLNSAAPAMEKTVVGKALANMPIPGLTGPFTFETPAIALGTTAMSALSELVAGNSEKAREVWGKKPELWMGRTPFSVWKIVHAKPDPYDDDRVVIRRGGRVIESTTITDLYLDGLLPGTKELRKRQYDTAMRLQYDSNQRADLRAKINRLLTSDDGEEQMEGIKLAYENAIPFDPNEIRWERLKNNMPPVVRRVYAEGDKSRRVAYAAAQMPTLTRSELNMMMVALKFDGSGDWFRDADGNSLVPANILNDFYAALSQRSRELSEQESQ